MKTYIKDGNAREIDKHIKDAYSSKIIETKLFALLKLVKEKGEPIDAPENDTLNGVKVLEYKQGYYVGFIKTEFATSFNKSAFKLKTISLKNI